MNADEIIRDLPNALINWYSFQADAEVLFVSGGKPECEVFFEALEEKDIRVVKAELSKLHTIEGEFDYIVAAGIIERSEEPKELLDKLKRLLKSSGKLLLGAENRLAIRYFCGDKDSFSGHVLDGIDGYIKVSEQRKKVIGGRAYSKAEYEKMLSYAGFSKRRFYAVMPELVRPQILIAEDYIPNEAIDLRVFPQYKSPETLFLEEERLYETLMENHMFHQMANAFFIECTVGGEILDIDQITVQGERDREGAMATIIKSHKQVVKRALHPEGRQKVGSLFENAEYLRKHGVPIVEGSLEGDTYTMPYIEGKMATDYFRETLRTDKQKFINELEKFRDMILASSEHVPYEEVNWRQFEPRWQKRKKDDPNIDQWQKRAFGTKEEKENIGVILKRGYIDMVSINCFHTEAGFVFFDQEFYIENCPANAIFIRTINFIYRDNPDLGKIYPLEELLKYFKLYEYQKTWYGRGNEFLERLRNDRELAGYHKQHRRDASTMISNRHRMDYSQEEYERLFKDIFKGIGSKKLYLFGSGQYSEKFIEQFGQYYEIAGILDNNPDRWGEKLQGIEIYPPSILEETEAAFKVFICIKFFDDVLTQLKEMGIRDISVYDPRLEYVRPLKQVYKPQEETPKKYHIGYVAGVFDLFHIGHLNIFKRAKEQCDYLIVGVVTDEQIIRSKKTRPYIPFDERLTIVQACKYVDEAVEIPVDNPDTEYAWHTYHFDAQFSGSDYANDPVWLAKKVFLQKHGSDMVFFPYTETTSSTEIKEHLSGEK
ncbi:MAG: adenylyltransferase/cytidyltransferase family protein [Clostridiales bacterium]|nr:adenylyltransferase/cytidyltransferase family protein [Clostridiales bacterium]